MYLDVFFASVYQNILERVDVQWDRLSKERRKKVSNGFPPVSDSSVCAKPCVRRLIPSLGPFPARSAYFVRGRSCTDPEWRVWDATATPMPSTRAVLKFPNFEAHNEAFMGFLF